MSIQLTEKVINGKKIRTNNQRTNEIVALWSEVPTMQLQGELFAVYSNYTSNHTEDYDLLVGNEQAKFEEATIIKAGNYLKIPVTDPTPAGVAQAWQTIWSDVAVEQKRTYQTDFEHYREDGTIVIYLSI
jgi:predicted transcriptional regulator YdeE